MNLWEDRPDVAPLTFHPKISQVAAELMEADAARVWHDQALFKVAHGRKTDAHQDHPYWPMQETNLDHGLDPVRAVDARQRCARVSTRQPRRSACASS